MSGSREWYEGRANGLRTINTQLSNLLSVYYEGTDDFEEALAAFAGNLRDDLDNTEKQIIALGK